MDMKGMEQLRKHVPDLNTPRGISADRAVPLGLVYTRHFLLRGFRPHPHLEH